jgi:hypothetical protein
MRERERERERERGIERIGEGGIREERREGTIIKHKVLMMGYLMFFLTDTHGIIYIGKMKNLLCI